MSASGGNGAYEQIDAEALDWALRMAEPTADWDEFLAWLEADPRRRPAMTMRSARWRPRPSWYADRRHPPLLLTKRLRRGLRAAMDRRCHGGCADRRDRSWRLAGARPQLHGRHDGR